MLVHTPRARENRIQQLRDFLAGVRAAPRWFALGALLIVTLSSSFLGSLPGTRL